MVSAAAQSLAGARMGSRSAAVRVTLFLAAIIHVPAHAQLDPLLRPARQSSKAASVALLSVTQAGQRLVAAGERGVILFSDDKGASWQQASVPVSVTLTQVRFATPQVGWAVGHAGVILHSADGGQTWTRKFDGAQAAALILASVKAAGKPTSEAARALLADAERLVADGADKPWLDAHVDEARSIVVGAYGMAMASEDGGKTWRSWTERIPNPKGRHLYGVASVDKHVVIVGEQGSVFASSDGGRSFTAHSTPYKGTYFGVLILDEQRWLAYGMLGNAYLSRDRGVTWEQVDTKAAQGASITHGTRLPSDGIVLSTNGGHLLVSKDRGRSFQQLGTAQAGPVTSFAAAADGSLVLAGLRGPARVPDPQAEISR